MNAVHSPARSAPTSLAGRVLRGADRHGDLELSCDAVVIGTGAGGAIAARVLTERGLSVIALEEGPHIPAREHGQMRPTESLRHVWRDGGMSFALGLGDSPLVNVTMGKVVGGSSMVTGGVCLRTPGEVLERWRTERGLHGLSERELEPHYDTVERWTNVTPVPVSARSRAITRFGEGLQRAHGVPLEALQRNTRDCEGLGRCNFGCPNEHKLSVDLSVLPHALSHGATIVSDARVDRIVMRDTRATAVEGRLGTRHRLRVHADRVIVAGGAWHNPVLLSRSGLGSRHLGRHMTLHPSLRLMARFDEPVRGWEGALQSAYSPHFMREGLTLVSLFIPPGPIAGVLPGFGPELMARTGDLQRIGIIGCLFHDEGGGTVHVPPLGREPIVSYRMDAHTRGRLSAVVRQVADIWFAAGAQEVFLPFVGGGPMDPDRLRRFPLESVRARRYEATSQHPLGTCRMGASPSESVVDPNGRLWGTDNVWVADGSVVPTSLGVNPQVTVMAMAHRVATRIAG